MSTPKTIAQLIALEEQRQKEGLELIASENFVSSEVLSAQGSVLTNKYAEGYPGKRYYGGCEVVDQIEEHARERAKALFGASWVNVQPHSGSQANFAVYAALLKPKDKILSLNLSQGGHLTHGASVNFSGQLYQSYSYGVERKTGQIDWNQLDAIAQEVKPQLIICGASAYSREWNYKRLREIADQVGALLWCDMAHTAGLIAAGLMENPLPHCHVVTTTTHKTLRGPRGGMILIGKDIDNPAGVKSKKGNLLPLSKLLDQGIFPGTQGGPLMHVIAAKAVAFREALTPAFKQYALQVQLNAKKLASALMAKGFQVISGGTDNHMFLLDLHPQGISGKRAERILGEAGITVNKNMIPYDPRSPLITSGIRIGTPAVTTRGLKEADMERIAQLIHTVLSQPKADQVHKSVAAEIKAWMGEKPLFLPMEPKL